MTENKDIIYPLTIAKYASITKAAEQLYISQPALTKYLKNLETRLDAELFIRGNNKLMLTPFGELYIKYAEEIAISTSNFVHEMQRYKSGEQLSVRIGFACTGLRQFVYRAVEETKTLSPSAIITLQEMSSHDIERAVHDNQLDLGFITVSQTQNPDLVTQIIMEEDVLLGIPASHPLSDFGTPCYAKHYPIIDLSYFKNDQFILRSTGTRFRQVTDKLFAQCNISPNIYLIARNPFSSIEFAETCNMCVFTTETFLTHLKAPQSMRFFTAGPTPAKLSMGVVCRKGEAFSLPATQLINSLHGLIKLSNKTVPQEK